MPNDADSTLEWLNSLPLPRPFTWQPYIYRRRLWYWFLCLVLLVIAVGTPLLYGISQLPAEPTTNDKVQPTQIALYLGALVVVSYVIFVYTLFRQYDDLKWLGQRGTLTEANIFAVFRSPKKIFVGYRYWDNNGKERDREAVIDIDSAHPLPELEAGMIVPVLYDPQKPEQRNYLWAEIANYLTHRQDIGTITTV